MVITGTILAWLVAWNFWHKQLEIVAGILFFGAAFFTYHLVVGQARLRWMIRNLKTYSNIAYLFDPYQLASLLASIDARALYYNYA